MRARVPPFDLIVITEPTLTDPVIFARRVVSGLSSTAAQRVAIQLRAKDWTPGQREQAAYAIAAMAQDSGAHLLINGDPALCAAVGAHGVQLPESGPSVTQARAMLPPDAWIGASCHDVHGLMRAAREGASFALLSPWNAVPGKGDALSRDSFRALCTQTRLPVYGLGGIDVAEIGQVLGHGAFGIAVIRAAHDADNTRGWIDSALRELTRARTPLD